VVAAAELRPSQCELVGQKVAAMMVDASFDPVRNPVFVSRDDYLIDGHHRWAAVVGRDAADGTLGEWTMDAVRVDAPISEVLLLANQWAAAFGIEKAAGSSPRSCARSPRADACRSGRPARRFREDVPMPAFGEVRCPK
jgi:hypothetical protein